MKISRTDKGPVVVEWDNGTKENIANPDNIKVSGKNRPARNSDYTATNLVRIHEGDRLLYELKLSEINQINGVAFAGTLQQAVDQIGLLFSDLPV